MNKMIKSLSQKIVEIGSVGALDLKRKRQRDPSDFLSVGRRSTARRGNVGFETGTQKTDSALKLRQSQATGKMGGGATNKLVKRKLGITAGTEMNNNKFKRLSELSTDEKDRTVSRMSTELTLANMKAGSVGASPEHIRQSQQAASVLKSVMGKHRKTKVRSKRHASQSDTGQNIKPANIDRAPKQGATSRIAASTELDWTHKLVEQLIVEKDWIQGAVNPKNKGACTPMTKSTCTPRRKALAKRFKKAGRKEKKSGGTGWEGKV